MIRKKVCLKGHQVYGLLCWALLFCPLGCGLFDHEGEDVALIIGSQRLSSDALKREMGFMGGGTPVPARHEKAVKDQLTQQVIDFYLIIEYARTNGISISENEFQRLLKEIKGEYTEETFRKALLEGYVDPEGWETRLRNQFLVTKVLKQVSNKIPAPTYEDIKVYFQENRNRFASPERLMFRQIVCRSLGIDGKAFRGGTGSRNRIWLRSSDWSLAGNVG